MMQFQLLNNVRCKLVELLTCYLLIWNLRTVQA